MNTPTSKTPETIIAASYARSYGENRGDKRLFNEIADTIEWLETRLRAAELKLQVTEDALVMAQNAAERRGEALKRYDLRAKLIRAQTVERLIQVCEELRGSGPKGGNEVDYAYDNALKHAIKMFHIDSPAEPDVQKVIEDAERWRMVPAFEEKYQINYVWLLRDINSARSASSDGERKT